LKKDDRRGDDADREQKEHQVAHERVANRVQHSDSAHDEQIEQRQGGRARSNHSPTGVGIGTLSSSSMRARVHAAEWCAAWARRHWTFG